MINYEQEISNWKDIAHSRENEIQNLKAYFKSTDHTPLEVKLQSDLNSAQDETTCLKRTLSQEMKSWETDQSNLKIQLEESQKANQDLQFERDEILASKSDLSQQLDIRNEGISSIMRYISQISVVPEVTDELKFINDFIKGLYCK